MNKFKAFELLVKHRINAIEEIKNQLDCTIKFGSDDHFSISFRIEDETFTIGSTVFEFHDFIYVFSRGLSKSEIIFGTRSDNPLIEGYCTYKLKGE